MNSYNTNKKILIIEDDKTTANLIINKINNELGYETILCKDYNETIEILEKRSDEFFASVLDLFLTGTFEDEIVNYVILKKIPLIVMTSNIDDNIRERILNKNIIDYIVKNNYGSIDHLIKLIRNLERNQKTKVLVIDDSEVSRKYISRLLKTQNLIVMEANSGKEALGILDSNMDIKLVITDYKMPEMSGFELLNQIRANYSIDKLAIIGISAHGNTLISTNFLKAGANDFIYKPFSDEEFKWRINQNIELIDYITTLRDIATKDSLTGLYNRHALFDLGIKLFENTKRGNIEITVSIIDIDSFKKINDTYGHYIGDLVIKNIAKILQSNFRASDFIARYGGDEFCIIAVNLRKENSFRHFEKIRNLIAEYKLNTKDGDIICTVSIGVMNTILDNLDSTINKADSLLYKAKKLGRNRTITDEM